MTKLSKVDVERLKAGLDCRDVARRLGMKTHGTGANVKVLCPAHDEKTASCNVSDSAWHCFGCQSSGDAIDLVRLVLGLSFGDALAWLGGCEQLPARARPAKAERPYPPIFDVRIMWEYAGWTRDDDEVRTYLEGRAIDPKVVDERSVAFAMTENIAPHVPGPWPEWSAWWPSSGYRLIVGLFDVEGVRRSWAARNVRSKGTRYPKSFGRKGLVMANRQAQRWLRGYGQPARMVLCEGEPDFITAACECDGVAVVGIGSGMWGKAYADKVPATCEVVCATHHDAAGEIYWAQVRRSFMGRPCRLRRWDQE